MTLIQILAQIEPPTQGVLLTGISVLWAALSAAVVAMWRYLVKELRECRRDHKKVWEALSRNGIHPDESEH